MRVSRELLKSDMLRGGLNLERGEALEKLRQRSAHIQKSQDDLSMAITGYEERFAVRRGLSADEIRYMHSRELFNAQGFPPLYRIEADAEGNRFSKSDQIGRAGNSVCPDMAKALAGANCPEMALSEAAA